MTISFPIIALGGCTSSGKSSLALKLAKEFSGVIVNADSKQVYKELQIGTTRPIPDRVTKSIWYIENVPHYLYGYVSIFDNYSLYRYQKDCFSLLKTLDQKNKPIFLVGGTGLYIDSIIKGYNLVENPNEVENSSLEYYDLKKLQKLVVNLGHKLNESDFNNKRRLIRILNKNRSIKNKTETITENSLYLHLDTEVIKLEKRIIQRVEKMFEDGLLEEVETYKKEIISKNPKFQIIGYQEFYDYFTGNISLEDVKSTIILHTRQYAKRQRTWFRNKTSSIKVKTFAQAKKIVAGYLLTFKKENFLK